MIYFDNGATTFPKPKRVLMAVNEAMQTYGANPGRSGHMMSLRGAEKIFECRENAAKLFDLDNPENVIFTNNCTMALNTVIKGVLNPGDHAVISSVEHNAVVRPLEYLKEKGVEYSVAKCIPYDDDKTIENFRNEFKDNTKLVICTQASNVFGIRLPVERISALCKIHNILFCVDAAQSAGVIDITLKNSGIDFLCTAGHKGLYGPMGTGILAINTEKNCSSLIQGGTGSDSINSKQPEILPDKYESGTPNLPGIAGLNEGIKYVISKTPKKIANYEIELAKKLYDELSLNNNIILYTKRPDIDNSVAVVSFNHKNYDSETLAGILDKKYNIALRAGLHCSPFAHKAFNTIKTGTVRAVMSTFTTAPMINYLISSLSKIN